MTATFRRTAATLSTEVGDDVVALQAERGFAYGMEEVTAELWRLLETPQNLDAIVARLTATYDVDIDRCRAEISTILGQLTAEGLVEKVQ
jgi:hypothetical protein